MEEESTRVGHKIHKVLDIMIEAVENLVGTMEVGFAWYIIIKGGNIIMLEEVGVEISRTCWTKGWRASKIIIEVDLVSGMRRNWNFIPI